MEDYFEAEGAPLHPRTMRSRGVVNADDPWGQKLLERARIPMVAVRHADARDVVLRLGPHRVCRRGLLRSGQLLTGGVNGTPCSPLEAALALDPDLSQRQIAVAAARLRPVPGRLQVIAAPSEPRASAVGLRGSGEEGTTDGPPFTVLVDYAHTPAGLEVVLAEARRLGPSASGRVICVFGCGGNRDRAKRPVMGRLAAQHSDLAFLTSDNPRDEDPDAIIDEVLGGVPGGRENPHVVVEPDRRAAIRRALDSAGAGDVVLIAGKGHETYQEIAGRRLPFDDAVEARDALSARFSSDPAAGGAGASPAPCSAAGGIHVSADRLCSDSSSRVASRCGSRFFPLPS